MTPEERKRKIEIFGRSPAGQRTRSGFKTLYHACEQGAGRFGKRSNLYGL